MFFKNSIGYFVPWKKRSIAKTQPSEEKKNPKTKCQNFENILTMHQDEGRQNVKIIHGKSSCVRIKRTKNRIYFL